MAGLMNAEIREPARTLPRAGWIASGLPTAFYAAATIAMLVILRPGNIRNMTVWTEPDTAAGAGFSAWRGCRRYSQLLVMASAVGQFGGLGTGVSRLPFAVGVDQSAARRPSRKVHPRWGTPYVVDPDLGACWPRFC